MKQCSRSSLCLFSPLLTELMKGPTSPVDLISFPETSSRTMELLIEVVIRGSVSTATYRDTVTIVETAKLLLIDISDLAFDREQAHHNLEVALSNDMLVEGGGLPSDEDDDNELHSTTTMTVSYTHLTLPTKA